METLTREQLKKLKAAAHSLKPVVQIGQKGLTGPVIAAIAKALEDHELIKIKFMEYKEEKRTLADEVTRETESHLIDIIGNIAILYKRNELSENDNDIGEN
ncbi:MAG TPA: YhbY family RNA-binding protein [Spirochaetota bacterium]|nr:YhbY family RNA-binding protein [Spirochaetota bacterium]